MNLVGNYSESTLPKIVGYSEKFLSLFSLDTFLHAHCYCNFTSVWHGQSRSSSIDMTDAIRRNVGLIPALSSRRSCILAFLPRNRAHRRTTLYRLALPGVYLYTHAHTPSVPSFLRILCASSRAVKCQIPISWRLRIHATNVYDGR